MEMPETRVLISSFVRLARDPVTHVLNRDLFAEMWLQENGAQVDGTLAQLRFKLKRESRERCACE